MNEKEKIELEELLSGCIDGQLSERQQTELRRIMEHQPQLKEQLKLLEKQSRLLRQLPVEKAPAGLADEIGASLQRRLLLASSEQTVSESRHRKLPAIRRMVSAAALVLAPLALLGAVMITILWPFGSEPSIDNELAGRTGLKVVGPGAGAADETRYASVLPEPSLEARLVLSTAQPIATNDYIEKRIYSSGLLGYTVSRRDADITTYTIVCSAEDMQGFVGELEGLLPHCDISTLTVSATDGKSARVDSVSPEQIGPLLEATDPQKREELARLFAEQNKDKALAKESDGAVGEKDISKPPATQKPIMAWDQGPAEKDKTAGRTVRFVLEVRGK